MGVRHISPCAGSWYPGDRMELEGLLEDRFAESERRTDPLLGGALGYVVPHAGPAWSGTVAAAAYRSLREQLAERVVVLGFSHRGGPAGVVAPDVDAIATPWGDVELDGGFGGFPRAAEARVCDHSLEIQLPFVQKAAPAARVTALYVGRLDAEGRRRSAQALAAAWQPGTVFIASSDFTHYGRSFGYVPFPADGNVRRRLHELDEDSIDAAGSLDSELFLETVAASGDTLCGTDPIALLLDTLTALGAADVYQARLDYQTSGELNGDYSHSVSYAALGYFRRRAFDLSEAECAALRAGAMAALGGVPRPTGPLLAGLAAHRGVFVSLHRAGELLGCMGNCFGGGPLGEDVPRLAVAAATEDPRFLPASLEDGPIDVEISVLTPFRRVRGPAQVEVGRHGVFLRAGGSGLLLPQVATERGWTAEQFLHALTRKASTGPRAWRDPRARLFVFEAQVF